MKTYSPTNCPSPYMSDYFPELLKTNLLSETAISQVHPAFICSNLAILTIELSAKYV